MHLINHLGHFPMGIGAARLSSLVVELDDVPGIDGDELSSAVFQAPNIQLLMLSNSIVMSLVELAALDAPGGGVTAGLTTAPSLVRVLLRDLAGKASWDSSILYSQPFVDDDLPLPFAKPSNNNYLLILVNNRLHSEGYITRRYLFLSFFNVHCDTVVSL